MPSIPGMITNRPLPGQGLTRNPDAPLPIEMPSRFVKVEDALDWMFKDLTSDKKFGFLIQVLNSGKARIDVIATSYIEQGVLEGRWNTDMAHILIEPTIFMLLWFASQIGAEVKFASLKAVDLDGVDVLNSKKKKSEDKTIQSLLVSTNDPSEEMIIDG